MKQIKPGDTCVLVQVKTLVLGSANHKPSG